MSTKKVKTITLGCRFNSYESEVAAALARSFDLDVVIINTCAVTHEAERQSKQAVRKAIREEKGKIIVTGCAVETAGEYFNSLDGVFKVIKNSEKNSLHSFLDLSEHSDTNNFDEQEILTRENLFEDKVRAFLQIQNGCNHFCTYCIVPFTRGKSKSMPLKNILQRIENFERQGFKELVFSGIDITSYGQDISDEKIEFADVLEAVLKKFPNQKRIRISSIDPKGINSRLFDLFANEERILPHFHLSVQSGDNDVLKAMKRRHSREDVISFCQNMISKRNVVFGADIIAGFPSETDAMFEKSVKLIKDAGLTLLHIFPYSPRKGTVAANMIQLSSHIIKERAKILRNVSFEAKQNYFKSLIGKNVSGIIERVDYDNKISYGKTDTFIPVLINKICESEELFKNLKVCEFDDFHLILNN